MKKTTPKTPKGLSREASSLWRKITGDYELDDHHLEILGLACHSLDRIAEARAAISADGLFVDDRFGQKKPHPAIEVELANKRAFRSLLRELGLDVAPLDEGHARVRRLPEHGRSKRS